MGNHSGVPIREGKTSQLSLDMAVCPLLIPPTSVSPTWGYQKISCWKIGHFFHHQSSTKVDSPSEKKMTNTPDSWQFSPSLSMSANSKAMVSILDDSDAISKSWRRPMVLLSSHFHGLSLNLISNFVKPWSSKHLPSSSSITDVFWCFLWVLVHHYPRTNVKLTTADGSHMLQHFYPSSMSNPLISPLKKHKKLHESHGIHHCRWPPNLLLSQNFFLFDLYLLYLLAFSSSRSRRQVMPGLTL